MFNYKLTIEYEGTEYEGVQEQLHSQNTIHDTLLKAICSVFPDEKIELVFCGRTDAGVHALKQVCNFKMNKEFRLSKLPLAINYYLRGKQIAVLLAESVEDDFNARYSCSSRTYVYKILNRSVKSPIMKNRMWLVPYKLDINEIQQVANIFIGTHDFAFYRNADCTSKTTIKTINYIKAWQEGDVIQIEVNAPSFLYKMVRNIVGAIIDVCRKAITVQSLKLALECKAKKSSQTAPAYGLYFINATFK